MANLENQGLLRKLKETTIKRQINYLPITYDCLQGFTNSRKIANQKEHWALASINVVFCNYVEDHNRRDNASEIYNFSSCIQTVHAPETIFSEL